MKKTVIVFFFLGLLMAYSCQKSDTAPSENTAELKFISLVATDNVMVINGINSIIANVSGESLSYKWTASYGTIIGSGPTVKWTVCHADTFTITCEVTDKYDQKASKDLNIMVTE